MFNAREIAKQMYYRNIFDEEAIDGTITLWSKKEEAKR